jgi:hypothetical protein
MNNFFVAMTIESFEQSCNIESSWRSHWSRVRERTMGISVSRALCDFFVPSGVPLITFVRLDHYALAGFG